MNTVTIKFGPGTAKMERYAGGRKSFAGKGLPIEPKEGIGIVKLTKDISDEPPIRKIGT